MNGSNDLPSPMTMIHVLSKNTERAFWLFQISGWAIFYFQHIFVFSPLEFTFHNLFVRTVLLGIGFVLSILLRYRLRRIDFLNYSFFSLLLIIFVSSLVCSTLWYVSGVAFVESMKRGFVTLGDATWTTMTVGIVRDNAVFVAWTGLYFGIKFWMNWVTQKEKTDEALSLARSAQLEMLRYQLNPHFLFNTLSTLRALTSDENKRAKEIITKISEFLRYSLIESDDNEVALSKEIEVIKNYLDIEKARFEDDLVVAFDVDQVTEVYPIPIFLVHPLVENAIKHGMQTSPIPLRIIITAKMVDDRLNISVFNTGRWIDRVNDNHPGKGLENIRRRLKVYSPDQHNFQIVKNADSVQVNISLKKESNKRSHGITV